MTRRMKKLKWTDPVRAANPALDKALSRFPYLGFASILDLRACMEWMMEPLVGLLIPNFTIAKNFRKSSRRRKCKGQGLEGLSHQELGGHLRCTRPAGTRHSDLRPHLLEQHGRDSSDWHSHQQQRRGLPPPNGSPYAQRRRPEGNFLSLNHAIFSSKPGSITCALSTS